jgi:CBS-domain-containing membrane protein
MARTDIRIDETLRHLGAAYYDSLRGRAPHSDVERALEAVEEHLKAQQRRVPGGVTAPGRIAAWPPGGARDPARAEGDMTKKVLTVDRLTAYSEIVRLLTERRISSVPVLPMRRHVAGAVSEADLVAAEDTDARQARIAAEARAGQYVPWGRPRRRTLLPAR